MRIVDVTTPTAPVWRGVVAGDDVTITLQGSRVYVSSGDIQIDDVSNPDAPAILAHMPVSVQPI